MSCVAAVVVVDVDHWICDGWHCAAAAAVGSCRSGCDGGCSRDIKYIVLFVTLPLLTGPLLMVP